jgi:hypothetical protein
MSNHFREQIEKTATYKSLNLFQREMTLMKTNLRHIEHGVQVANLSGYDYFDHTNNQYTERNKKIVKEIHESQQSKSA